MASAFGKHESFDHSDTGYSLSQANMTIADMRLAYGPKYSKDYNAGLGFHHMETHYQQNIRVNCTHLSEIIYSYVKPERRVTDALAHVIGSHACKT